MLTRPVSMYDMSLLSRSTRAADEGGDPDDEDLRCENTTMNPAGK